MDNQFPLPGPTLPISSSVTPLPAPEEAAPPPPGYQPPPVSAAPATKPPFPKKIALVVAGVVALLLVVFLVFRIFGASSDTKSAVTGDKSVTLTYWGLWEPAQVMTPLIAQFEATHPNIKIDYQLQSPSDYQDRLRTVLSSPNPPDIVRLHTTWLPIFVRDLIPAPANTISATEMSTNFYPIINRLLVVNNQVYGIPFAADSLALFINTAMFQQKSLNPPTTWEDLDTAANALKDIDPVTGKLVRAGVALGTTSNVDHWSDILTLMLYQSGVNMYDPKGSDLETTIRYYTQFAQKDKVWDTTMPSSVVAFANEKVAMIFAPSWRAWEIKAINPSLSWKVVPVPQLPEADVVNWASVWFEGVPKNSAHPQEAWEFLSYLSSAEAQQLIYESAAKDREFPQPPAHKAVATIAQSHPVLSPFVSALDTARTFYTAGDTRDSETGLNYRLIKYLEDAVNGISLNQEVPLTLDTLNKGFQQILSQYNIVSPSAAK